VEKQKQKQKQKTRKKKEETEIHKIKEIETKGQGDRGVEIDSHIGREEKMHERGRQTDRQKEPI
jgi:hypothetical protein